MTVIALLALGTAHATAWVLPADRPRRLRRAIRAARGAEVTRVVAYDDKTACVEVEEPTLRVRNRVERRIRAPVEPRIDCDWAWFPEGRGRLAMLVEQPAPELLPALRRLDWPYYDLRVPTDGLIRVCVAETVVPDPPGLLAFLRAEEVPVRGIRSVGACRRDPR